MADGAKRAEELADLLVFVSALGLFQAVGLLQTLNSPVIFGLRGKQLALGHKHRRHSAVQRVSIFDSPVYAESMGTLSDKGKVDITSHGYMIDNIERSQVTLSARESALPKHLFRYPVWACQEFR